MADLTSNDRLCGACGRPIPTGGSVHCGTEHAPESVSDERLAALIKYGAPFGLAPHDLMKIVRELQEKRANETQSRLEEAVTRGADVRELRAEVNRLLDLLRGWSVYECSRELKAATRAAIAGLPHETTGYRGWMPIETAPTDPAESFLVTDGVYIAEAWRRGKKFENTVDGIEFTDASHWMPNPPLPKRSSEETPALPRLQEAFRLLNAATYYVPRPRELHKEIIAWLNGATTVEASSQETTEPRRAPVIPAQPATAVTGNEARGLGAPEETLETPYFTDAELREGLPPVTGQDLEAVQAVIDQLWTNKKRRSLSSPEKASDSLDTLDDRGEWANQ